MLPEFLFFYTDWHFVQTAQLTECVFSGVFLLNTCVIRPQWWWCEVISSDSESKRTKTLTQFHQHTAAELKQRTTHQIQSKSIFKCVYFVHQTDVNNHVSAPEWLQLSESSREKQCRCENQTKLLKNNLSRFRICLFFTVRSTFQFSETGTGAFFLFNSFSSHLSWNKYEVAAPLRAERLILPHLFSSRPAGQSVWAEKCP